MGFAGGVEGLVALAATRLRADLSRFFCFLLFGFVFAIVEFRGCREGVGCGGKELGFAVEDFGSGSISFFSLSMMTLSFEFRLDPC